MECSWFSTFITHSATIEDIVETLMYYNIDLAISVIENSNFIDYLIRTCTQSYT